MFSGEGESQSLVECRAYVKADAAPLSVPVLESSCGGEAAAILQQQYSHIVTYNVSMCIYTFYYYPLSYKLLYRPDLTTSLVQKNKLK